MTTSVFREISVALDGIARTGIVHVGANRGQELDDYRRAGFTNVVLIEPNPAIAAPPGVTFHQVACGPAGHATLHITAWDERSSLLDPVDFDVASTVTVPVVPLADLQHGCNVAVVDVQGAEVSVLGSADLDRLDAVIVEHCDVARYSGAATGADIESFMLDRGWTPASRWPGGHSKGIEDVVWRPDF